MSNIAFVGLPRYSLGSLASGASRPADKPLSKLTDWQAWSRCRLLSADPRLTYVEAVPTMPLGYHGPTPSVGGLAWPNHSLRLGATARSIALSPGAAGYLPERVLPDGKTDVSGTWSGTVADVADDPHAPDANRNTCLGSSSLTPGVRYTFATPASTPRTGADRQLVRVKVTWTGDAPTGFTFELADGATVLADLEFSVAGSNPDVTNGAVLTMPWDAALLVTANGSGLNLRIDCTLGSGSDDLSIEAVDWLCDSALTSGSILADTGWRAATMDRFDATWGATVSGAVGVAPQQTLVHVFPANVPNVGKVATLFRDPLNTSGHVDLGEMVAGPQFVPTYNRDWGSLVKLIGRDSITELESGADSVLRREPKRQMTVPLSWLTKVEAYSLLERLWRAGAGVPFAVATVPDDVTESTHTALYVRCTGMPDLSARRGNVDFRSLSIELTEAR